jgi:hypothetical protein
MEGEARQGFLIAERAIGAGAGFRNAGELRWTHRSGSGVCHPFAARGGMKLSGTAVVGAIRMLGPRAGP